MMQNVHIKKAYYLNNAKDKIEVHYTTQDSSGVFVAQTSKTEKENSLWAQAHDQLTVEAMTSFTQEHIQEIDDRRRRIDEQKKAIQTEKVNDDLFKAKLEIFELPEIKDSKNRTMKSKIRKAETLNQVYIYAGAMIALETLKKEKESK